MGVNGAHTLTYGLHGLSVQQIFTIALFIFNKYNTTNINRPPTIYIDASWVIRSCSVENKVGYLIRLTSVLVSAGFRIVLVCDGTVRHHSKRSTTKRTAAAYESKVLLNRHNGFMMNLLNKKIPLIA
jgi:hypothetical protein